MENLDKSAFTTSSILNQSEPIHFVFHDEDGDWHFMPNRSVSEGDASIVSVEQMLKLDPALEEVLSLPCGNMAERLDLNKWIRKKMS